MDRRRREMTSRFWSGERVGGRRRRGGAPFLLAAAMSMALTLAHPCAAQSYDRVEIQIGGGYVGGGGVSLPTYELGAAFWLTERWGVAVRRVGAPGDDLRDPAGRFDGALAVDAGAGNLRYATVTARYRRFLDSGLEVNLGVGVGTNRSMERVEFLIESGRPPLPRRRTVSQRMGLALELLVGRKLSRRFGVKGGVTHAFGAHLDSAGYTHAVGLGVIGF